LKVVVLEKMLAPEVQSVLLSPLDRPARSKCWGHARERPKSWNLVIHTPVLIAARYPPYSYTKLSVFH